jgi:hypothetical protein
MIYREETTVRRIESNEYFDAVPAYFVDNKVPARVYKLLLDTLRLAGFLLASDGERSKGV